MRSHPILDNLQLPLATIDYRNLQLILMIARRKLSRSNRLMVELDPRVRWSNGQTIITADIQKTFKI